MADPETPQNAPEQQRDASPESPGERAERVGAPPSYDAAKQDYTGISAGALHDTDDLRAARAFAEMIVDTVREGLLVLDFDLRVEAANESFYRLFGVPPEQTLGRRVYELGNGQWDLPELRTLLEEILPHRKVFNDYEVDHAFEGVGRRVMLLNARRLDDHELILLAIEDVTERRAGEQALRQSEEQFRLLVENAHEYAIFAMNEEARITLWNPGAERILGWSRSEALGKLGSIIFTPEDREAGIPEREIAQARADGSALDERWHVRKDGSRFWASGMMVAIEDQSLRGFAKILRDNTRRKEAEEALRKLNETLEQRVTERTRQVRELSRALTLAEQKERQRIAHVLHDDLQQLLFGAQMASSLGDADRLDAVLTEAMTLTRSLSHEMSPPLLQGEDLEDLLRRLAEQKQRRYGLDVDIRVGEGLVLAASDLRVLLYQIVRELLFNVAKHAGTKRARVVAERTDGCVRVVVEDEGVGFDPALLEEAGAAGLGLPSARERLELVGGELAIESVPGQGTRVTITLPVS